MSKHVKSQYGDFCAVCGEWDPEGFYDNVKWPCDAAKAEAALAAYARLAADGFDIDQNLYLNDAIYHAIVYRIHRGKPDPAALAKWEASR